MFTCVIFSSNVDHLILMIWVILCVTMKVTITTLEICLRVYFK